MPGVSRVWPRPIRVWDTGMRLPHRFLIVSVALAFLSSGEDDAWSAWRIPLGWIAALQIAFRRVWARAGDAAPTIGCNPLDAFAVLALLGLNAATVFTGGVLLRAGDMIVIIKNMRML